MRLRAYAELGRVSNAPTCVSNVLVGVAIAGGAARDQWIDAAILAPAILALYFGGMALNDVLDVEVDRRERPSRVLPSGRLSLLAAKRFVWVCLTLGLGILAIKGLAGFAVGLVLAATIVAYDALHRRSAWTVLLMGACRGLVYIACAAAVRWPVDWTTAGPLAGAITAYIVALSIAARREVDEGARPGPVLPIVPLLIVVLPGFWFQGRVDALSVKIAVLGLGLWLVVAAHQLLRRPPRVKSAVLRWLSGICLVDAFYLTLLDEPVMASVAAVCFALTAWGHRGIAGT